MKRMPIPGSSPSAFDHTTSPSSSNGSARWGMVSLNRNRVPMVSGFFVLMNVPPLEMFFV
jgi:hypothetical protein